MMKKLNSIHDKTQQRAIIGVRDLFGSPFGFDFIVENGSVVEIQLVAAGITKIPRILGDLPFLRHLILQSNRLKSLQNIEKVKNLRILNVADNQLTNLGELKDLKQVDSLDISHNQIASIEELQNMESLVVLTANHNKITSIPTFSHLKRLKTLDLADNPIEKLENLNVLESLVNLKLNNTALSSQEQQVLTNSLEEIKNFCLKNQKMR